MQALHVRAIEPGIAAVQQLCLSLTVTTDASCFCKMLTLCKTTTFSSLEDRPCIVENLAAQPSRPAWLPDMLFASKALVRRVRLQESP